MLWHAMLRPRARDAFAAVRLGELAFASQELCRTFRKLSMLTFSGGDLGARKWMHATQSQCPVPRRQPSPHPPLRMGDAFRLPGTFLWEGVLSDSKQSAPRL